MAYSHDKGAKMIYNDVIQRRTQVSIGDLVATLGIALAVLSGGCHDAAAPPREKPKAEVAFQPQEMADSLRAVIAADREVYARLVYEPYRGQLPELPLPAHMLKQASGAVQQKGAEFHYVLRSLWPINPRNRPETPTEEQGLKYVAEHPEANFYAEESLGGRRYFIGVYRDVAVVPACVECHNTHKTASKKDFKLGDVMGGIIVRVPLEF